MDHQHTREVTISGTRVRLVNALPCPDLPAGDLVEVNILLEKGIRAAVTPNQKMESAAALNVTSQNIKKKAAF